MIISDLNHLETVEATQVIGGSRGRGQRINYDKDIKVDRDVDSDVKSRADVKGNVAGGFVDSIAEGKDTFTDAELILEAKEDKYSRSTAQGVAAVR